MTRADRATVGAALTVGTIAAVVFWRTAYPTITWWDSSNYSLAAVTLGVTSPPGSLLLTLIGWMATRVPLPFEAARTLNLLAGVLGALASALVMVVSLRLLRALSPSSRTPRLPEIAGAATGALGFAFAATLWEHATKFTPYVLTVVFTGLILFALIRWWEEADRPEAWRWIALVTFLIGLDFSVHRTNALLIPGAMAWILVRRPRTLVQPRAVAAAIGGMIGGLSLHLMLIPISASTSSPLNMFQPDRWSSFWDYVSLSQTGGNFQLTLWPRNSPFWSNQVGDIVRTFGDNFAHTGSEVTVAGWLPLILGLGGIAVMFRRNARLAMAFVLLGFTQVAATVIYFNIPPDFFRSLDRHYLPVMATFAVAMAVGCAAGMQLLAGWWKRKPVLVASGAAVVVFLPVAQLVANWNANDASRRFFTRDFATNALQALPPNAFFFTVGDNDTFPVMYMQAVEHVRPDVRIINLSLANTNWFIDQFRRRDPSFPVQGSSGDRQAANAANWRDSTLVVVDGADSVTFRPRPAYGGAPLPADDVFLDVVRHARFSVPVTVSRTAGESGLAWLQPYARIDGMHWRLVPTRNPPADAIVLRSNLFDRNQYRGYADSTVVVDDVARTMGFLYLSAFRALLQAELAAGDVERCRAMHREITALLPPGRLRSDVANPPSLDGICEAR